MTSTRRLRGSATPAAVGMAGFPLPWDDTVMSPGATRCSSSSALTRSARARASLSLISSEPVASVWPLTETEMARRRSTAPAMDAMADCDYASRVVVPASK